MNNFTFFKYFNTIIHFRKIKYILISFCHGNEYRIFFSDDYETTRRNLGQAEIISDFTDVSEVANKRIHNPNRKYVSNSSSSSDFSESSKDVSTKDKYKETSIRNEIPQSSKERRCSEMDLPKALRQKSNRILNVTQNLSLKPSRRNSATHSRWPINKADENVDQLQEGNLSFFMTFKIDLHSIIVTL